MPCRIGWRFHLNEFKIYFKPRNKLLHLWLVITIFQTQNVTSIFNQLGTRGDGGTLGHGAHWDICIFGSCVVYQKLESLGWRASDITYHLL